LQKSKQIASINTEKKPRGRPKQFDFDDASERALALFWTQGFEGTSLADLSQALNMNRPSIYASFGNKDALFKITLNRYLNQQLKFIDTAISKASLEEVIDAIFEGEISLLSQFEPPRGCLLVQAAVTCSKQSESIKALLISERRAIEGKLRKRIQLAQLKKDFPMKQSPSLLAKSLMTIYEGISIEAASGSSKADLLNIAELSKKILS